MRLSLLLGLIPSVIAPAGCAASRPAPAPAPSRAAVRTPPPPAVPATAVEPEPISVASAEPAPAPPAPWPPAGLPRVESDWCIDGIAALDEQTCYVLPDAPSRTLLIYLHGIVPPKKTSEPKTRVESIVRDAAERAHVVALMPRGKRGLAPRSTPDWWGWPTSDGLYAKYGPTLAARISASKQQLETLLGQRFEHVYVAGSSSGAYFAAELALHGGIAADGFGAMSGGAGQKLPGLAELAPKPFYIGYGSHDTVGPAARALGDVLRHAGWPVHVSVHKVGHGAQGVYIDEAFDFWRAEANDPKLTRR